MARGTNGSRIINPADAGFSLLGVLDIRAFVTVIVFYTICSVPLCWFAPLDIILFDLAAGDAAALMQEYQHELVQFNILPIDCPLDVGVQFTPNSVGLAINYWVQRASPVF